MRKPTYRTIFTENRGEVWHTFVGKESGVIRYVAIGFTQKPVKLWIEVYGEPKRENAIGGPKITFNLTPKFAQQLGQALTSLVEEGTPYIVLEDLS